MIPLSEGPHESSTGLEKQTKNPADAQFHHRQMWYLRVRPRYLFCFKAPKMIWVYSPGKNHCNHYSLDRWTAWLCDPRKLYNFSCALVSSWVKQEFLNVSCLLGCWYQRGIYGNGLKSKKCNKNINWKILAVIISLSLWLPPLTVWTRIGTSFSSSAGEADALSTRQKRERECSLKWGPLYSISY